MGNSFLTPRRARDRHDGDCRLDVVGTPTPTAPASLTNRTAAVRWRLSSTVVQCMTRI